MDENFMVKLKAVLAQLDSRVSALEHTVNETIIGSLKEASDEYDYEDFKTKYGEQIGAIEPKMKTLYGEDYDTYHDLYDTMSSHRGDEGFDEATYVADMLNEVNAKLDALAKSMGPQVEEKVAEAAPEETVVETTEEEPSEEDFSEEELMEALKNAQ